MRGLAGILLIVTASCELFQPPAASPSPTWTELEASHFGGLRNVSRYKGVWFGGGVTEADVELAYRRGVRCVLDLSFPEEDRGFDLGRACFDLGIDLYDPNLLSAEALTDRNADEALDLFRDPERHPLLVVCETGSNGATLFALWRALDHGMPLEEALLEARRAGMRPGPLEEFVRQQFGRLRASGG